MLARFTVVAHTHNFLSTATALSSAGLNVSSLCIMAHSFPIINPHTWRRSVQTAARASAAATARALLQQHGIKISLLHVPATACICNQTMTDPRMSNTAESDIATGNCLVHNPGNGTYMEVERVNMEVDEFEATKFMHHAEMAMLMAMLMASYLA